jgi:para-nitrobenzyl esterase
MNKPTRSPNTTRFPQLSITRRRLLECAFVGTAGIATDAWAAPRSLQNADNHPFVDAPAGKLRGTADNGIVTFKGIPYGAPTGGKNRFLPPQRLARWSGIRDATEFGPRAIQKLLDLPQERTSPLKLAAGFCSPDPSKFSEDCLRLNIWAPRAAPRNKYPVMFWCHGQGFSGGSGDLPWLDGGNLARKNDVVVVSINHRLNIFGFLYLGDIAASKYPDSGNVGMLDIVAGLQWVHDNIAAFGGDPNNVTIFGQSGGGSKVSVLMAMPPAKGLFHKAIAQSGSLNRTLSREEATRTATKVLAELELTASNVDELQNVPAQRLLDVLESVREAEHLSVVDRELRYFNPVVDGRSLLRQPWDPGAPEMSADVPLMVGTTANEGTLIGMVDPSAFSIDQPALHTQLKQLGFTEPQIEQLVAAYGSARPNASPSDLLFAIASDRLFRIQTIHQAERKAAQGRAPVYMYVFSWNAPAFGGKFKAFHGVEQPFVFDNLDLAPGVWDSKRDSRCDELAEKVSRAWVAFATRGDPHHSELPSWEPYRLDNRRTMVFNFTCRQVDDPDRQDRLATDRIIGSQL